MHEKAAILMRSRDFALPSMLMAPGREPPEAMTETWEPADAGGVRSSGLIDLERDAADLVERVRRGEPAAFEQLAREVAPRLYRLAVHLSGSTDEAEDLVQETLVRALPALRRFEGRARLSTYLVRTLGNLWKNRLRSRARSRVRGWLRLGVSPGDREAAAVDPIDPGPLAVESMMVEDRAARVRWAVSRLQPERRWVLLLREVEERSYEEIAALTGLPVGTVRSRLARAREDLRRLLGDEA
jgi:RNA polymerase sigma-70 factor (ECF subfamily)